MAIYGTIGLGAQGKTLTTAWKLWLLYQRGKTIVSNTPLYDLRTKRIVTPNGKTMAVPVNVKTFGDSWAKYYIAGIGALPYLDNCELLVDEIAGWLPKHEWQSVPRDVRRFIAQDRREGVNLHWTHRTDRVFLDIYENTIDLTTCYRIGPVIQLESKDPQRKDERPRRSLFISEPTKWHLYDTWYRIGDKDGDGGGQGARWDKREDSSGCVFARDVETIDKKIMQVRIALNWDQVDCLVRKYGIEAAGIQREEKDGRIIYSPAPVA